MIYQFVVGGGRFSLTLPAPMRAIMLGATKPSLGGKPAGHCAILDPLHRLGSHDESAESPFGQVPILGYSSEGPIIVERLQEQLIGRVVGVFQTRVVHVRPALSQ